MTLEQALPCLAPTDELKLAMAFILSKHLTLCVFPVRLGFAQCGQVTLEQVLPYLGPTDEMKADHDKARKQLDNDAAQLLKTVLDAQGSCNNDILDSLYCP